jgi:hypothetical protein
VFRLVRYRPGDGAEGAADGADVGGVEHGGLDRLGHLGVRRHGFAPFAAAGSEQPADGQSARVRLRRGAAVSGMGIKKDAPTTGGNPAPVGRLGPSFNKILFGWPSNRREGERANALFVDTDVGEGRLIERLAALRRYA